MTFPKESAFHQDNDFADGQPLKSIAEVQEERAQRREAVLRKEARIPLDDLEGIVTELRQLPWTLDIEDVALNDSVEGLANRLASYLP